MAPSARSCGLLFSGNDGLEQELTLIGGMAPESKDKPEGIAEVWMVNVQVPPGFSIKAPETTNPPITTEKPTKKPLTEETKTSEESTGKESTEEEQTKETKVTKPLVTMSTRSTRSPADRKNLKAPQDQQSLFDAGSPQKIAALVLGSFVAIILLVAGITVLGFSIVGSAGAAGGSRNVLEPYTSV